MDPKTSWRVTGNRDGNEELARWFATLEDET
jgi:hypothetical protein